MPTRSSSPPVLRLSSPDDVLAAVPYLLGFHPHQSLVVLGLSGPRSRLGVNMRVDLAGEPDRVADVVVSALRRDRAEEAIVVVYEPPDTGENSLAGMEWVEVLRTALLPAGIRLREALRVDEGRWWSYLCREPHCCPPEGTPVRAPDSPGGPSRVAATAVAAGMAALPDRAALRASLDPPAPWTRAAVEQALDRVGAELAGRLTRGEAEQVSEGYLDAFRTLLARFGGRCPSLSDDEAATLAIALHCTELRDEVITWTVRDDPEPLRQLLVEVVRKVGPPENVPAATVLAWCAYQQGNGALAAVALEIVAETDPDYSLAALVDEMLQAGIHPDQLRRTTVATAKELARRRRRRGSKTPPAPDR
jgi:hypothetical protein